MDEPQRHYQSMLQEPSWVTDELGNVRELEHAVEQAYLLSDGSELEPQDFGLIHSNNSALSITLQTESNVTQAFGRKHEMTLERLLLEEFLLRSITTDPKPLNV